MLGNEWYISIINTTVCTPWQEDHVALNGHVVVKHAGDDQEDDDEGENGQKDDGFDRSGEEEKSNRGQFLSVLERYTDSHDRGQY